MVDNSTLPVAVGTEVFANDDISSVKYPRVKATWGPDGIANDADVATGKPLPVQVRSATGLIPFGEPTDAKASTSDATSITWTQIFKQLSFSIQAAAASLAGVLSTGGMTVTQPASSTITRPADTTTYTVGDLIANSVTAGSVAALQFTTLARVSGGSGAIVSAKVQKSTNVVTNVAMRLHLFNTIPTFTSAGDNSALSTVVVALAKGYLGYIDIPAFTAFSDSAWGSGAPDNARGSIPYVATAQIIYGLLEARGAFAPGNAEVFTIVLDALQD